MNCEKEDLLLYAVTDRSRLSGTSLDDAVEAAIRGGATFVQLREKNLDEEAFLEEALRIREICRKYHVPFVINDNVEIALKSDADGVHVGQTDMEAGDVRARLGPDKIIGVSAHTVEEAVRASESGADYLGAGAMFPTTTKDVTVSLGIDELRAITEAVDIPVVAIGGINGGNILRLKGSGIAGVAVVSAIFAEEDPEKAARELKASARQVIGG